MSISQINRIIKAVKEDKITLDQCHSSAKKKKWTDDILAFIAAAVENDLHIMVQ